jgi:hypothetical protein
MTEIKSLFDLVLYADTETAIEELEKHPRLTKERQFGATILHQAAFCGNVDVVRAALRLGADVNATDDVGRTPLLNVPPTHNPERAFEIIKLLSLHRADFTVTDRAGRSVLHFHCHGKIDDTSILRFLLQNGADMWLTTKGEYNPYSKTHYGSSPPVKYILEMQEWEERCGRPPKKIVKTMKSLKTVKNAKNLKTTGNLKEQTTRAFTD